MSSNTKFGLAYGLCALLLCGCTNRDEYSDREQSGGQKLSLTASIDGVSSDRSKAPIDGVAFANGTHRFGLSFTEVGGVVAYETGSGHISASAVVSGATQSWSYSWVSMNRTDLPLLYGDAPMLVAAYYPYSASAGSVAGRDNGRFNVPFDLSTTIEQSNQTDVLYSAPQTLNYSSGLVGNREVALSFRHLYALVDLQIKLKDDKKEATIIQVEVCNNANKTFLSNKGFFSPYTGQLTASTAGDVSLATSTALNVDSYATIRLMVPPTVLQDYADGDILVKVYGSDDPATPKWFPILKEHLASSGDGGFVGGGRYTYRVVYHTSEFSSLTFVGWRTSVPKFEDVGGGDISGILAIEGWGNNPVPEEVLGTGDINPPTPDQIVEIDGLRWTKGNLVAKNSKECKVGAPTDYGVYFHFGSLVGWSGGANGDGVGATNTSLATAVQVKPKGYSGSTSWPAGYYQGGTTDTKGYDLPADAPTTGIGDPCRYYLGAPWRTPTAAEWLTLLGANGDNTNKGVPLKHNNYDLFFPASGNRNNSNGTFDYVGSDGFYWSSSVTTATNGYSLYFFSGFVFPQYSVSRSSGVPVRCVGSVE